MVSEVETILSEIRERVRADQEQRSASGTLVVSGGPGAESPADRTAESGSGSAESLANLSAHLTTTARAWDRLPPLYSNRSGMTARLELRIKAGLKSLARWFTWEQVNFNAAVHHALSDTLAALRTHEQELLKIRADSKQETEARLARFEQFEHEVQALRAHVEAQVAPIRSRVSSLATQNDAIETRLAETNADQANLRANLDARISEISTQLSETSTRLSETSTRLSETSTRLSETITRLSETSTRLSEISTEDDTRISNLAKEIDGRLSALAADLREEQRVCFKQLSLETSEAVALEDRGRRVIESRLEKLEQSPAPRKK